MRDRGSTTIAREGSAAMRAIVAAVVVLVLSVTWAVTRADLDRHGDQTRAQVQTVAGGLEARLEQELASHGAITQSLGAIVDDDGRVDPDSFPKLANRLMNIRDGIRALELAPDGIIEHVHPVVGNEAAVGLDLNRHPSGQLALDALRAGTPVVVEGPISLAQGGQAVILRSRIAISGDTPTAERTFWGAAITVVDLTALLEQVGLDDAPEIRWSLHRGDGTVALDDLILGVDVTDERPVTTTVDVPGGVWTLAVVPADGWPSSSPNTWLLIGAGLAVALTAALFTFQLLSEPLRLRQRVNEASRELEASHSQTRAIMNSAADAILAADCQGKVVGWNPAACRLLRAEEADLERTHLQHHLPLSRIAMTEGSDGYKLGRELLEVTRADGSTFPAEVAVATYADSKLQTVIIRDVSVAHQREADLRRHVLELERMRQEQDAIDAVKRDFMAMASHEVRTPITAIRGFALTLNRHWDQLEDEDRRRSLDVIHRQATRLWHVVSDVLTTSQLEGGDLDSRISPVHLRTTIEEAIAEAQVPPGRVNLDCAAGLTARLDATHLNRILVALLTNAQKYGAAPYDVTATVDGTDLVVRVIDHGSGVPLAFRDKLFDPFSQASTGVTREAIGTGLGLSVARGLARASGGDVWHEERPGVGAVFAVRLPRAVDRSPDAMHDRLVPAEQVVMANQPSGLPG